MEKRRKRKLNNAGMSLVEIVVVVLILGILSAGSVVGLSYINQADASSAAESVTTALDRTRLATLAAEDGVAVKMTLSKEDKKYYATITQDATEVDKVEIGGASLSVTVKQGGTVTEINESNSCEFTFQKSNGAFTSTYDNITLSSSDTCIVWMVKVTGRSYIEYE